MEVQGFSDLVKEHGFLGAISIVLFFTIMFRGAKIWDWILTTIQAAAIVKEHEKTIGELKSLIDTQKHEFSDLLSTERGKYEGEIRALRMQLEALNETIREQTAAIAKLEERNKRYEDLMSRKIATPRAKRDRNANND